MDSSDLTHSQASKQAARTLAMLNYRLELAASTLGIDIIPTEIFLKPNQFPMEVFSDEESGPEDVEDEVARTFASYGVPYQLPVGGFILRRPKPYLSTLVSAPTPDDNDRTDHLHMPDEEAYSLCAKPVQITPWKTFRWPEEDYWTSVNQHTYGTPTRGVDD